MAQDLRTRPIHANAYADFMLNFRGMKFINTKTGSEIIKCGVFFSLWEFANFPGNIENDGRIKIEEKPSWKKWERGEFREKNYKFKTNGKKNYTKN
ncbi:MAG: hypothetical protein UT21_C0006G0039 [Candidatus Woesebacteria bacterium GW2011_GWA1_39_11b]|nr:MAG: hypothetical protein UT21_C0006G0039 [Candidatus Woesebacteria bacterium GW2011_GWA1_39_11b]KKS77117.1 MAG: hypothetical protein UV51_C0010G0022 [Candidatus Woesebacteria bacterium GW2011_GWC1_42_9]